MKSLQLKGLLIVDLFMVMVLAFKFSLNISAAKISFTDLLYKMQKNKRHCNFMVVVLVLSFSSKCKVPFLTGSAKLCVT